MEVPGMEEGKSESHLTSPAAFVEGGIQEACEDSCSICLEAFCDSDPGTVTSCKHEFHLQCILEWCQRSSNCPMCWQAISLKDPTSQELLEAVEQERRFRFNPTRNSTIFHHPTLGDFELQHLPVGVNDSELEDRIIQHLAAAAAMGRTHHVGRREGSRNRSAAHGRPQFLVFSTNPNAPSAATISASAAPAEGLAQPVAVASPVGGEAEPAAVESVGHRPRLQLVGVGPFNMVNKGPPLFIGIHVTSIPFCGSSSSLSALPDQDRAGPSELQTASDTWKSRFSAISTRYKESVSKSTRGWKERLFNKSPSMSNIGTEVRREVNAGIANMSRMIERLEVGENNRQDQDDIRDSSSSNLAEWSSDAGEGNRNRVETAAAGARAASN
ncbi:hypothetical protein OSB04_009471 [Centaurea solstitialis]|uniref:RING-type E3 ubiquitin transferase n=1 Tax=Centaurea solstitialis TaxID=347529 RepID=A0AA38WAY4_9ASTR|nr:hypothetical protein OSB04_009471 [Centaurea solstitialis]